MVDQDPGQRRRASTSTDSISARADAFRAAAVRRDWWGLVGPGVAGAIAALVLVLLLVVNAWRAFGDGEALLGVLNLVGCLLVVGLAALIEGAGHGQGSARTAPLRSPAPPGRLPAATRMAAPPAATEPRGQPPDLPAGRPAQKVEREPAPRVPQSETERDANPG